MREHEVPTHVQTEDRVLLWFTFPQIVAITAVCALAYGAYSYAPVGPPQVRMALAAVLGLAGITAVVGQIGGRRLPLVIADLLRFRLGPRLYAGTPAQLLRSEPPPPPPASPGPLTLLARRARCRLRRLRKGRERRNGRRRLSLPGRTGRLAGLKKRLKDAVRRRAARENRRGKRWFAVLTVASLSFLILTAHQAALADEGLIEEGWNDRGDRVRAPGAGPRTKTVHGAAGGVGGPRPSLAEGGHRPRGVGPRIRRGGEPPRCACGGRRPWEGERATTTTSPYPASRPPSTSLGRTRWARPGPSPWRAGSCRTRFRHSRESCAI